jgi:hypothetical protein
MVPASEPQAVSDLISGQVDLYFGNSPRAAAGNDKIRCWRSAPRKGCGGLDIPRWPRRAGL